MITWLMYKYGLLKEGNPIHGFISMYCVAIDFAFVILVIIIMYNYFI